jgi:hypothetical protein
MSTNIDPFIWPAEFFCTIIDDDLILPNHYNIKFFIEPVTDNVESVGLGFRRLRYLVQNCLQNCVFINLNNSLAELLNQTSSNIVHLPTDPYDLAVGSVLYHKFITVSEKYFNIYQFSIDSALGDRIQYTIRDPLDVNLELDGDYWWNKDNANTGPGTAITWESLDLSEAPKFEPKIIKGGLSANQ